MKLQTHEHPEVSGEDAAYTEGEKEFADGQGTHLDEETILLPGIP